MNQTTLKLRGGAAAAFAALIASSFVACSGDDTATTPPDSGSTTSTASSSSSAVSSSSSSSTPHDSGASDATVTEAGATDAGDAAAEAAAPTPVQALNWCSLLFVDFGFPPDAGNPVADFSNLIINDMSNPEAFLPALNADCHFGGLNGIVVTDGGPNDLATWEQQLNAFAVGIFGCTQAGLGAIDAGAATIHDLLPAGQANVTLTQADVKLLVETFVNAVVTEVTDDYYTNVFSGVYPAGALLTDEQVLQLQAELNAIAAATPNVSPSTTLYTYNTCVADAGSADASDGQ